MTQPSSRSVRRAARLTVAILAVLAIGLSAPPARAAPPEVKASENPVSFACPVQRGTTKMITLTWSVVAGTQLPKLVVAEGAKTVLDTGNIITPPYTGAAVLTVEYGLTYEAQLKSVTDQPLGQPLIITTKCAGSGGSGGTVASASGTQPPIVNCAATDCGNATLPSNVTVTPHGTWAAFKATTGQPAYMTLKLSKKAPVNKGWTNPADVIHSQTTILPTASWTPQDVMGLEAGTTFHYAVEATYSGLTLTTVGSFTTLTRHVTVTFDDVDIIDDSDGFLAGNGEMMFYFFVNNVYQFQYGCICPTGSDFDPKKGPLLFKSAPAKLTLAVTGVDDDKDFGEACSYGLGPPSAPLGNGSNSCRDWSTADGVFTLPTGKSEVVSGQSFGLLSASGWPLAYLVGGSFKVEYK